MSAFRKLKVWLGWCPNVTKTELETRFVEYGTASINAGMPVRKWKFDLLILGHICALLFASLFLLPVSTNQALNLYTSPYLPQNYGSLLADITVSIASVLFSVATVMLIYNIAIFKKLYMKYCYFNVVLLSGLFIAITLQFSLLIAGNMLERTIYWAFIFALPISIPSLLTIKLDNMYGGQKIVKNGNDLAAIVSCEWKYIDKIKAIGLREVLGVLHLVFGAGLIATAFMVLAKPTIFPWWIMNIDIISSGLLLAVGMTSLVNFFGLMKSANIHRILALVNVILLAVFFLYLSQFLLSPFTYNSTLNVSSLDKPFNNYGFVLETLLRFTLMIGMPSILTFFIRPVGEKRTGFLMAALLILLIVFASLGAYYLYLNRQKDTMLAEESGDNGEYKLYSAEPDVAGYPYYPYYPYYLDSPGDTTGHPVSKDTYEAIQFLRNKEEAKVLSWWDLELEIKSAGKEPVISYASEATKFTIGRFALPYTRFEPDEKVADVSRFFTTDSEDEAKSIAEKYGAGMVYIPKERMPGDIFISMFTGANGIIYRGFSSDNPIPADFEKTVYEPSMAYKFNSGAELKYFKKIFENRDVIIYTLNFSVEKYK